MFIHFLNEINQENAINFNFLLNEQLFKNLFIYIRKNIRNSPKVYF